MAYYQTGTNVIRVTETDLGITIRATTTHTTKVIQCYVSGELRAWQDPSASGIVIFHLPQVRRTDVIFLLAVDVANTDTDYWSDAFPQASSIGNRIKVRTPQIPFQGLGCKWKVYRGDAGDASATLLVHEQEFYPGGRRTLGFGMDFGYQFGYDGRDCKGFGYSFGHVFGFDCENLAWISEPLPLGTYPIKVIVEDVHGNESTEATTSIALSTYARPAKSLTVDSYTKGTDTLALSWTASPDV